MGAAIRERGRFSNSWIIVSILNQPPEPMPNRKLIILEPSLKNMGGHYYEYDAAISAAASRRSIRTILYAHKNCDAGLAIPGGEVHSWFSKTWSEAGGGSGPSARRLLNKLPMALRVPLTILGRSAWRWKKARARKHADPQAKTSSAEAVNFGTEAVNALQHASCSANDIVLLPTIRTSELFALWETICQASQLPQYRFHVVLRRDAAEMDLPEHGAPGISFLFQELLKNKSQNNFRFYCDTRQLCDDYAALCSGQLEFTLLPIPFPNPAADPEQLEKWSANPAVKLVYLGGARMEKGFHLLVAAEKMLRNKGGPRLLWRLQAPLCDGIEEPEVTAARKALSLVRDGSVELVEENLSSAAFQSLLLSADIVLLPYLAEYYRARSSGVLVQVLAAGKPVIVPARSWLSSQTDGFGAVEFNGGDDLAGAICRAVKDRSRLICEARQRAAAYGDFHNAATLVAKLESREET